jgi:nitrile hydratase accessory protein
MAAEPSLDLAGPAAPPRRNGELVFEAPWESRLFGVTLALCRGGRFEWEEFRRALIAAIADWERGGHSPEDWSYYRCWAAALERVLAEKKLCAPPELDEREHALAARAPGHDHRHD